MLRDVTTSAAVNLKRIPEEIDHGIIFVVNPLKKFIKRMLSKFESFPLSTPPSERSYAEKVEDIETELFFPLSDDRLLAYCKNFIITGDFSKEANAFDEKSSAKKRK